MIIKDTTVSTNDDIKALAREGAAEWTTVIAKKQTGGRGQVGREFYSPEGGLYMSVLLRPKLEAAQMCLITTAAAVAVARAVETVFGTETRVKWVNDLYYKERKVCGILTEACPGEEAFAVLGIGLNIVKPAGGYPKEIADIAGALTDGGDISRTREEIAAEIIKEFKALYVELPAVTYREEYVRRMGAGGQTVTVTSGDGEQYKAIVKGVDEDFRLVLDRGGETVIIGEKNRIRY